MSYSLNTKCGLCKKRKECVDEAFIQGAITGIHSVNCWDFKDNKTINRGHRGSGQITLDCVLFEQQDVV